MNATAQSIAQELTDSKGFKKYFKGGFGKKAKAAAALWNGASAKGVFAVVPVADFSTSGVGKIIYAFATKSGALTDEIIEELASRASSLTPEQIDAEDRNYVLGFEPLIAPVGHPANKKGSAPALVPHLSDGFANVRTFLHTTLFFDASDRQKSRAVAVIYARQNDEDYIKVLEARQV